MPRMCVQEGPEAPNQKGPLLNTRMAAMFMRQTKLGDAEHLLCPKRRTTVLAALTQGDIQCAMAVLADAAFRSHHAAKYVPASAAAMEWLVSATADRTAAKHYACLFSSAQRRRISEYLQAPARWASEFRGSRAAERRPARPQTVEAVQRLNAAGDRRGKCNLPIASRTLAKFTTKLLSKWEKAIVADDTGRYVHSESPPPKLGTRVVLWAFCLWQEPNVTAWSWTDGAAPPEW
jgi:hypothetical protein